MNIIDAMIILIIILGAVIGFKNGVIRQAVSLVGFFLVVVLAFAFKNSLSVWMYEHLPFFNFWGILKGVTVINILLYEVIAFLILVGLFTILFKIVLFAAKIIEKILEFTVILGIPSKILGLIVGAVECYIFVFIFLYIVTLPFFDTKSVSESKYAMRILENTPILSNFTTEATDVLNDFVELKDKYTSGISTKDFNRDSLIVLLEHKVVTPESIEKLVERNKIQIDDIEEILNNYR